MGRIISFYIIPLFLLWLFSLEYLSRHNGESICYGFEKMNIPFAADIVNFVIILALFFFY